MGRDGVSVDVVVVVDGVLGVFASVMMLIVSDTKAFFVEVFGDFGERGGFRVVFLGVFRFWEFYGIKGNY